MCLSDQEKKKKITSSFVPPPLFWGEEGEKRSIDHQSYNPFER